MLSELNRLIVIGGIVTLPVSQTEKINSAPLTLFLLSYSNFKSLNSNGSENSLCEISK